MIQFKTNDALKVLAIISYLFA